jgi:glucokinase
VGIGSPGPLDLDAGVVIGMPNIPGFQNVPLRDRLAERVGMRAVLENDANAAAVGEYMVGSGRGTSLMVLLTLGTGVGSGIIIDGRLLHGSHGIGGEVGHMIVDPGGEECGCGQRGCLERYASATYLARHARRLIEREGRPSRLAEVLREKGDIDARDVCDARRAGDALAGEVWDRAVRFLAIACVSLCRVLDPDRIVLGGGMAKAGDDLLGPLRAHFRREHWNLAPPRTELALASLGNDAGVIGAAGVAWEQFGK